MQADVSNAIRIMNPTPECRAYYIDKLTFDNPEYAKKERMGLWLGDTPRKISLVKSGADWIEIPFGMLRDVFWHKGEFSEIRNKTAHESVHIDYCSDIVPYDYQEKAINAALKQKNGVIVAPCGSGKTQIGLEIIARLGLRALWLTHTGELLRQSMDRARSVLDISESTYGTITEGRINLGSSITFATVQTMCRIDLSDVRDYFDVVVVDEAHRVSGSPTKITMFWKVISGLNARYKFGLTATPKRGDGLIGCMFALIGPRVYEIEKWQVSAALCPVQVHIREVEYKPNFEVILAPDGTLQYTSLINDMTQNEARNKQIVEDIAFVSGHGRRGLVLTDRVQHVLTLSNALSKLGLRCATLYGSVGKKSRNGVIDQLKNGDIDLIVASFALAKEGLDIPNLDDVFFTTPQKNETVVVQSAGRVARKAKGKDHGNVYDYVDSFGMLRGWASRRRSIYKKSEFVIA